MREVHAALEAAVITYEAEKGALACLLVGASPDLVRTVAPQDFADPLHARLFACMQTMHAEGAPLNVLAIQDRIKLDEIEMKRLASLLDPMLTPRPNVDLAAYVRIIRRESKVRRLLGECESLEKANGDATAIVERIALASQEYLAAAKSQAESTLPKREWKRLSITELYAVQEIEIDWQAHPILAPGLAAVIDAPPKSGKTRLILEAIVAAERRKHFLSFPTKPIRAVYVSEQSMASLAMQMREVGFTESVPVENFCCICREQWSRFAFVDFLQGLENELLKGSQYNALIFDTWHSIARLEDENSASEVADIGGRTLDVAARNGLALLLSRHDRKSGGEIGQSGRSSIQLSGLVDIIAHLTLIGNDPAQRKLELIGRVPGLPPQQIIELKNGEYVSLGEPGEHDAASDADSVAAQLIEGCALSVRSIEQRTDIGRNRVKKLAAMRGWAMDDDGIWHKGEPS